MDIKTEDIKHYKVTGITIKLPDELRYADLTEPEGYVKEVDKDGRPTKPGYINGRRRTLAPKQRFELYVQQLKSPECDTLIHRVLRNKIGERGDDNKWSTFANVQKGRSDT
jgi:hypothetical protein